MYLFEQKEQKMVPCMCPKQHVDGAGGCHGDMMTLRCHSLHHSSIAVYGGKISLDSCVMLYLSCREIKLITKSS